MPQSHWYQPRGMRKGNLVVNYCSAFAAAWKRFNTELGWARSSHVAMSMMLALFPFCIFVLAVTAQLSAEVSEEAIVAFVFGTWPEEIAAPIVGEVVAVLEQSSAQTALLSAILAMVFASKGVEAVRTALTYAYREPDTRPYWRKRLVSVAFVFGGAVIVCLAGLLSVVTPLYFRFVLGTVPELYPTVFSSTAIRTSLTIGLLCFALYAAHTWLTGHIKPLSAIWPGILLNIFMWCTIGLVFSIYIETFADYSVTYAGLAGIMAALIFMYIMAAIFVFCAEFNGQLQKPSTAQVRNSDKSAG